MVFIVLGRDCCVRGSPALTLSLSQLTSSDKFKARTAASFRSRLSSNAERSEYKFAIADLFNQSCLISNFRERYHSNTDLPN